jgi:flagellar protein FliO/FliZ
MDTVDYPRFFLALIFVIGLIGLCGLLLRRYAAAQNLPLKGASARMRIIETRHLDAKRRLVLVARDEKEYLLLLTDGREQVIDSFSPTQTSSGQ